LPFEYIVVPENLSRGGGGSRDRHCRLCGAENTEREKLSGRQKSAGEIPSQRGEIIAIITTIVLDFIGIIIIILIITSTSISTITTPSRCNILNLVQFLGETFSVLITLVVDAIEWNRGIKVYVQIVIYHYFTSGHDPYDVL
jgi:hypothetical protein